MRGISVSWKASEPMSPLPTWPVMQTIGDESIIAVAMPVTMLVAPGPEVAIATPTRPGARAQPAASWLAPVAVSHVRRALLVADENVTNGKVEHRVVRRQNRAAGIPEDVRHTLAHE